MSVWASQITGRSSVYSTTCSSWHKETPTFCVTYWHFQFHSLLTSSRTWHYATHCISCAIHYWLFCFIINLQNGKSDNNNSILLYRQYCAKQRNGLIFIKEISIHGKTVFKRSLYCDGVLESRQEGSLKTNSIPCLPMRLCRQVIGSRWYCPYRMNESLFYRRRLSTTLAISAPRNVRNCKYIFVCFHETEFQHVKG